MTYQRERDAALRFANRYRKQEGRKPLKGLPKGYRSDPLGCPLGRATLAEADTDWLQPDDGEQIDYPALVARFVYLFDMGKLPDLEA